MSKEIIRKNNINDLIERIRNEILKGKRNIENTILNEKTKTYWNIGMHIHEHLLVNAQDNEYGDYLFNTLENNLNIHKRTLYRAVQFFQTYPEIITIMCKLTWGHFIVLLKVKDINKRKEYEQKVINENLTMRELQELINKDKNENNENKITQLQLTRGKLNTYKLKFKENKQPALTIDLGFRFYTNRLDNNNSYTKDSIIEVTMKKNLYTIEIIENITIQQLYTYKGELREIIDGDTFWIDIDLGFDTWTQQKLRLRGINAANPETETGINAMKFIKRKLTPCKFIIIKTYYRDKYNRYLADIFYDKNEDDIFKVAETGIHLNQQLLDEKLAEKV
ncbi:MAG: hypothetical protein JXJ22_07555 [Bacteroidales bacterium]|nr:hypothetical protein [Bacteroidales bacterium]